MIGQLVRMCTLPVCCLASGRPSNMLYPLASHVVSLAMRALQSNSNSFTCVFTAFIKFAFAGTSTLARMSNLDALSGCPGLALSPQRRSSLRHGGARAAHAARG